MPLADAERAALDARWQECERLIQEIHAGRVVPGSDPASLEAALSDEMDSIEYTLGMADFSERE